VVRGIVQTHNGVITAESRPGEGTTFHVLLPVMKSSRKRNASRPPA